ncbi:MAG: DUF368 domain-containing protein [Oscillospiraceae bacterium]|nr:DUF368 domain-containing protein [Oscillospiraceae bacterium]
MGFFAKAKESIILALKGIVIGIGNAIPGVSGGTIAVVTKIYDRLIGAITPNIKKLIKNMPFLIPVGIGMVIGIFLTSVALEQLFENYNVPTQLTFLGLIVGSLPLVLNESKKEQKKIRPVNLIPFAVGVLFMIALLFAGSGKALFSGGELGIRDVVLYIIMGFVAAVTMIIPGVSGSMVMKIFGAYDSVITAVANLEIPVLICFGAGAVIGVFVAAKVIDVLIKKYRQGVYCLIIGLIVGSVPHIFPAEFRFDVQGIIGMILFFVGAAVPLLMENPFKKKDKETVE